MEPSDRPCNTCGRRWPEVGFRLHSRGRGFRPQCLACEAEERRTQRARRKAWIKQFGPDVPMPRPPGRPRQDWKDEAVRRPKMPPITLDPNRPSGSQRSDNPDDLAGVPRREPSLFSAPPLPNGVRSRLAARRAKNGERWPDYLPPIE